MDQRRGSAGQAAGAGAGGAAAGAQQGGWQQDAQGNWWRQDAQGQWHQWQGGAQQGGSQQSSTQQASTQQAAAQQSTGEQSADAAGAQGGWQQDAQGNWWRQDAQGQWHQWQQGQEQGQQSASGQAAQQSTAQQGQGQHGQGQHGQAGAAEGWYQDAQGNWQQGQQQASQYGAAAAGAAAGGAAAGIAAAGVFAEESQSLTFADEAAGQGAGGSVYQPAGDSNQGSGDVYQGGGGGDVYQGGGGGDVYQGGGGGDVYQGSNDVYQGGGSEAAFGAIPEGDDGDAEGSPVLAIIFGLGAAVLGTGAWYWSAILTGKYYGWIAILMGTIIGGATAAGAGRGGHKVAFASVAFFFFSFVTAEFLIASHLYQVWDEMESEYGAELYSSGVEIDGDYTDEEAAELYGVTLEEWNSWSAMDRLSAREEIDEYYGTGDSLDDILSDDSDIDDDDEDLFTFGSFLSNLPAHLGIIGFFFLGLGAWQAYKFPAAAGLR